MFARNLYLTGRIFDRMLLPPGETRESVIQKTWDQVEREKHENAFIESLGGIEEFKSALAMSSDAKIQGFFRALSDPESKDFSVSEIAHEYGIKVADLATVFKDYKLSQGLINMISKAPDVANDIAEDARSVFVCCNRCDGVGEIPKRDNTWVKCPQCDGVGKTRRPGDVDARKMMFEAIGYSKKGGLVNVNVDARGVSVENALADFDAIDASPLPAEE